MMMPSQQFTKKLRLPQKSYFRWKRSCRNLLPASIWNSKSLRPLVRNKPNDLWIEFPFSPEYLGVIQEELSGKTSGKIIALMGSNDQITIPELAEAIGISDRSVERTIRKLQQDGRLRRIGPAKGGYWEVTQ
jgi:Winged helix-turn-helix DNA-binding